MERPTISTQLFDRLTKRARVWYWRNVSAWDMAHRISNEVTEEQHSEAAKLLDSVQRYALADAHQWERANTYERYCNSKQCKQDEERLDRRRERLQERLKRYGLQLVNYGLYPRLEDIHTKETCYFLHYFD